jgi:hypothetical protein
MLVPSGHIHAGVPEVGRRDRGRSFDVRETQRARRRPAGDGQPVAMADPAPRPPRAPGRQSEPVRRGRRKDVPDADVSARPGPRPKSERVIVDASNVAHATEKTSPRLANVRLVRDRLTLDGMTPILVADAALRHRIDDADGYEALVKAGEIQQAPAGTDADYFILTFARELDASVLSNDRFKDRIAHFPEVKDRIIRYMIVAGEVVLERRGKPRRGEAGKTR